MILAALATNAALAIAGAPPAALGPLLAAVQAADSQFVCPAEIAAGWAVAPVPEGWQASRADAARRYRFRGASFSNGHPDRLAYLKPYGTRTARVAARDVRTVEYRFAGAYPEGVWLVCGYRDTPAILYRRLPKRPDACEVTYTPDSASVPVHAIRCK